MERPKVTAELPKREVTGEIMYLDEMRRAGQFPEPYDTLSDMAIQMYEESADLLEAHGVRPDIMDEYERYDAQFSDTYASCAALAEELLALKDAKHETTFVDIVVETPAEEVLAKLHEAGLDTMFAKDSDQLAIGYRDSRHSAMDIRKREASLAGVGLTVWGWSDDQKYFILGKGENSPLLYPSGEQSKWYEIELSFSYRHPEHGHFSEKITLSLGTQGDLSFNTNVYVAAYAEQGYEGHGGAHLFSPSDEQVIQFADIVAEIVGDEPLSARQWYDRDLQSFINKVCLPESAEYLREWLINSWSGQVSGDIRRIKCGDTFLVLALLDPARAEEAHRVLAELVDRKRASRNKAAQDTSKSQYFGEVEPWRDLVKR